MSSETILLSIGSVVLVSLVSLLGVGYLFLKADQLKKITIFLVSLAAGTLLGDVFFHIIPEIYEGSTNTSALSAFILTGILSFFILEKILHWRHNHEEFTQEHVHPIAVNNLVADGLHNFVDGLVIGISYLVSTELGIATTIAVLLHEIPQELGDFGILVHSGMKASKALFFNFLSAILSIVGVIFAFVIGTNFEAATGFLLAFAAGGFIYIAIADLMPELRHEEKLGKSLLHVLFIVIGIVIMFGLTFFEAHGEEEGDTVEISAVVK
jgi:zinc and cadmium transporter